QLPIHSDHTRRNRKVAARVSSGLSEQRHDIALSKIQKTLETRKLSPSFRCFEPVPVELALLESLPCIRVRHGFALMAGEMRKLLASTFPHGIGKLAREIREEQEGARLAELLAHENKRIGWREQEDRLQHLQIAAVGELRQAFAQ